MYQYQVAILYWGETKNNMAPVSGAMLFFHRRFENETYAFFLSSYALRA